MSVLNGVSLEKGFLWKPCHSSVRSWDLSSEYDCRDRLHHCKCHELRGTWRCVKINLAIIFSSSKRLWLEDTGVKNTFLNNCFYTKLFSCSVVRVHFLGQEQRIRENVGDGLKILFCLSSFLC